MKSTGFSMEPPPKTPGKSHADARKRFVAKMRKEVENGMLLDVRNRLARKLAKLKGTT